MDDTINNLKRIARGPETSHGTISKGAAINAVSAIRTLQKIASMTVGKNPLAEAKAMRDLARGVLGINDKGQRTRTSAASEVSAAPDCCVARTTE